MSPLPKGWGSHAPAWTSRFPWVLLGCSNCHVCPASAPTRWPETRRTGWAASPQDSPQSSVRFLRLREYARIYAATAKGAYLIGVIRTRECPTRWTRCSCFCKPFHVLKSPSFPEVNSGRALAVVRESPCPELIPTDHGLLSPASVTHEKQPQKCSLTLCRLCAPRKTRWRAADSEGLGLIPSSSSRCVAASPRLERVLSLWGMRRLLQGDLESKPHVKRVGPGTQGHEASSGSWRARCLSTSAGGCS